MSRTLADQYIDPFDAYIRGANLGPALKKAVLLGLRLGGIKACTHILRNRGESLDHDLELVLAIEPLDRLPRALHGGRRKKLRLIVYFGRGRLRPQRKAEHAS